MKNFIILILCILFFQPVFAAGVYKKLELSYENKEPAAGKILYDYILKEENMTPKEIEDLANITPQSVIAFEEDLNDDRVNEIIGFVYSAFYSGSAGYNLFILQKQDNEYKNITYILNFEPTLAFYILNSKTNGYRNIKLHGAAAYKFKPFVIKYKNNIYENAKQIKSLKNTIKR